MRLVNKEQVKENFSGVAITYDNYAKVQKIMAKKLLRKVLATGKKFNNILEIGCGTGFLTKLLAENFPVSNIVAIDISPSMVEVAKRKLASFSNINFLVRDGENLSIEGSFELIVSSAVFQWFNQYDQSFDIYHKILVDGGYFIFNTLGEKTFIELNHALKTLGMSISKTAYINAFELEKVLQECNFIPWEVEEQLIRDYYPNARKLLVGIKKIGAQSRCLSGNGSSLKIAEIYKLISFYDKNFIQDQQVYATYHVLYGLALKRTKNVKC